MTDIALPSPSSLIKAYDPWREREVLVSPDDPRLVGAQEQNLVDLSLRAQLGLSTIHPALGKLDDEQLAAFRLEINSIGSAALQAPTGAGKTLISLCLAAYFLKLHPDKHVLISCPTNLIIDQFGRAACGDEKQNSVFNDPSQFVTIFSQRAAAVRSATYQSPAGRIIIGSASSLSRDALSNTIDPERVSLVIIDEAHLARKQEAAAVLREWCNNFGVRTLQCSATLTRTQKPTLKHIEAFIEHAEVSRFTQLSNRYIEGFTVSREPLPADPTKPSWKPDFKTQIQSLKGIALDAIVYPKNGNPNAHLLRGSKFKVHDPEFLNLPQSVAEAALLIARDLAELLDSTSRDLQNDESEAANDLYKQCRRLRKAIRLDDEKLVPSAQSFQMFAEALKAYAECDGSSQGEGAVYLDRVRNAYTAVTLSHLHQLLTTQPRIGFLEFAGNLLFEERIGISKAHHRALFPPGRAPKWWMDMSRNTPFDALNQLIPADSTAFTLKSWLANNGVQVESAETAREAFFSSRRKGLGVAAKQLIKCSDFDEHPKIGWILANIKGSIVAKNPGQMLVYCAEIIPTLYYTEKIAREARTLVVPLIGNSGLTASERRANAELARSGQASVVCSTSIGGIGVDLQNLRYLFITEPTANLREVEQLWGRVGRMLGETGMIYITGTHGYRDWVRDYARRSQQISLDVLPPGQHESYQRKISDPNYKPKRRSACRREVVEQRGLF